MGRSIAFSPPAKLPRSVILNNVVDKFDTANQK